MGTPARPCFNICPHTHRTINHQVNQYLNLLSSGILVMSLAGKHRYTGSNLLQLLFLFKSCTDLWMSCDFDPTLSLHTHTDTHTHTHTHIYTYTHKYSNIKINHTTANSDSTSLWWVTCNDEYSAHLGHPPNPETHAHTSWDLSPKQCLYGKVI